MIWRMDEDGISKAKLKKTLSEEKESKWFEFRVIGDSCQELLWNIGAGLRPEFGKKFENRAGTKGRISRNNIYYQIFLGLV